MATSRTGLGGCFSIKAQPSRQSVWAEPKSLFAQLIAIVLLSRISFGNRFGVFKKLDPTRRFFNVIAFPCLKDCPFQYQSVPHSLTGNPNEFQTAFQESTCEFWLLSVTCA
jgi:hypothetical protein